MDREKDRGLAYAAGKFGEAEHALATGAGPIKDRLWEALRCIHPVRPDDLPEPLRDRVRNLREQSTRVFSQSRLRAMRTDHAVATAREIVEVSAMVRAADERRSRRRD